MDGSCWHFNCERGKLGVESVEATWLAKGEGVEDLASDWYPSGYPWILKHFSIRCPGIA